MEVKIMSWNSEHFGSKKGILVTSENFVDKIVDFIISLQLIKNISSVSSLKLLWLNRSGLILGLRPANKRQRYFVTMSLIGWAQA